MEFTYENKYRFSPIQLTSTWFLKMQWNDFSFLQISIWFDKSVAFLLYLIFPLSFQFLYGWLKDLFKILIFCFVSNDIQNLSLCCFYSICILTVNQNEEVVIIDFNHESFVSIYRLQLKSICLLHTWTISKFETKTKNKWDKMIRDVYQSTPNSNLMSIAIC